MLILNSRVYPFHTTRSYRHQNRISKLLGLFIKTLAKPMAKRVQHQATKHPTGRSFLIWLGQTQHAVGTRMTMWSSGYTVRHISPIEEGAALSQGAELFSESFIFFVSGGIVVYEYNRSSEKEKAKEESRLQQIELFGQATGIPGRVRQSESTRFSFRGGYWDKWKICRAGRSSPYQ